MRIRSTPLRRWVPTVFSLALSVLLVALSAWRAAPANAQDARTVRTWRAKCASCHGPDGKALTDQGRKMAIPDISTAQWQSSKTDDQIREQIRSGIKTEKAGVKKEMEAFRDKLSAEQVDALVAYIRTLRH